MPKVIGPYPVRVFVPREDGWHYMLPRTYAKAGSPSAAVRIARAAGHVVRDQHETPALADSPRGREWHVTASK